MNSKQHTTWEQAVGGEKSPYQFELNLSPGDRFDAPPPFPLLEVVNSAEFVADKIILQKLRINATVPEDDREEHIDIIRVVALFADNQEVELLRETVGTSTPDSIDITKCSACWRVIPLGEAVILDTKAYHQRCVK